MTAISPRVIKGMAPNAKRTHLVRTGGDRISHVASRVGVDAFFYITESAKSPWGEVASVRCADQVTVRVPAGIA